MALDKNHPDPLYHIGRLLGVFEVVMRRARQEAVNAINPHTFGAVCRNPALYLPKIRHEVDRHLKASWARTGNGGAWRDLPDYVAQVIAEIDASIDAYPSQLSVEQQGVLQIGYFHQVGVMAHGPKPKPPALAIVQQGDAA